jgi:hypothetical protein
MELVLVLAALAAFDVVALRWGRDSRPAFLRPDERPVPRDL